MNIGILYAFLAIVCAMEMLIILNRTKATSYKETIDVPFCRMLTFFAVFCSVDALWGVFVSKEVIISQMGFRIVSYGFHSVAAVSAFIWFGYMLHYMKLSEKECKLLNVVRGALIVLQVAALVSNIWTHEGFEVDLEGNYHTGSLRKILYLLQFSYYIVLIIFAIGKLIAGSKHMRRHRTAIIFSSLPLLFGLAQFLFYDAPMYSLGFSVSALAIYSFNVTAERQGFLEDQFYSLNRQHSSIIHGLAGDFAEIYYVDMETGNFDMYTKAKSGVGLEKSQNDKTDYFESVQLNKDKYVVPEDRHIIEEKITREGVQKELRDKSMFILQIRVQQNGKQKYYQYKYVRPMAEGEENKLIVGVYDVDEEVRAEQEKKEQMRLAKEREASLANEANRWSEAANMDILTDIGNRRAYEDDVLFCSAMPLRDDLVYVSMDLNGLKVINDSKGHEAGDELLKGAATCMKACFGSYGKVYRTGGDEFVAIIYADEQKLAAIQSAFEQTTKQWRGFYSSGLAVSCGYVMSKEVPELSLLEIAQMADKRMYEAKSAYYQKKGIDRRGRNTVYEALSDIYVKMLRVDLIADTYSVLKLDSREAEKESYQKHYTEWIRDFVKLEMVYKEDVEKFLSMTDISFVRDYFQQGNKNLAFSYLRKRGDEFIKAMLEMIPAKDYASENQVVFLFVRYEIQEPKKTACM